MSYKQPGKKLPFYNIYRQFRNILNLAEVFETKGTANKEISNIEGYREEVGLSGTQL
jgi:hypothetical protein